jgi:uncharacterized membrane protein
MEPNTGKPYRSRFLKRIVVALFAGIMVAWLFYTPQGLLGKADAVGYAVCHRIAERSFYIGDRQLPLCARCSGMHLGALLGFIYQLRYGKKGGMPARKILVLLGFFLLSFGVDGVNSYLHLIPRAPCLYEPQNWLRLVTGTALGLGIAAMLYPVVNQTFWADWDPAPALHSGKQVLALLGISALVDAALLSGNPLLLYPLALLSAANVLLVLGLIYAIVWVLLGKMDNRYTTLEGAWLPLLAGLATAILQIGLMDMARFILTGTWNGFFI